MISVRTSTQIRFAIHTLAATSILALLLAGCRGTSMARRDRTAIAGEGVQVTDPLSPNRLPETPREEPPGPVSEPPPEPFDAWNKVPREETFWERIDIGGSVEVQGIWGKNLPYRRDRYGRTKLQLEASYPRESARMGVVIQSRRSWYP